MQLRNLKVEYPQYFEEHALIKYCSRRNGFAREKGEVFLERLKAGMATVGDWIAASKINLENELLKLGKEERKLIEHLNFSDRFTDMEEDGFISCLNIHDKYGTHEIEALLRYKGYLLQIIETGIQISNVEDNWDDESLFIKLWPEFYKFSQNLTVEFSIEKFVKDKEKHLHFNLDVAILEIISSGEEFLSEGLPIGSSDNLSQLDAMGVAGFPEYNWGDRGYFAIGKITGFKKISSIQFILVDCALISGNSGGPGLDVNGNVIGIVNIGADNFQNAKSTEKHGLLPVEVLQLLE